MTDKIAHRGGDGTHYWVQGSVGFGHQQYWTTPESVAETQPFRDSARAYYITLDGRVDNRDELRRTLRGRGVELAAAAGDAEFVVAAYRIWGEQCPRHILGDFAFAIWDDVDKRLFCARDILGLRPFYYHFDGRKLLFGSELCQLLQDPSIAVEPNLALVCEYLATAISSLDETLIRNVWRLPGAHSLTLANGKLRTQCYWRIDLGRQLRYKAPSDYVDQLIELLQLALRSRLRSHGKVAVSLSGGLDSSTVAGTAQALFQQGLAAEAGFSCFSLLFPGLACDEAEEIKRYTDLLRIPCYPVTMETPAACAVAQWVAQYRDFPPYPNLAIYQSLLARARGQGFRVMLSGSGSDELFDKTSFRYADIFRQLNVVAFVRQLGSDWGNREWDWLRYEIIKRGLRPVLPRRARRLWRMLKPRPQVDPFPWVDGSFATTQQLYERVVVQPLQQLDAQRFASYSQRLSVDWLGNGYFRQFLESSEQLAARSGIEERHPFFDRRLIEFGLALPPECHRHHERKPVLRAVLNRLQPQTAEHHFSHASGSPIYVDTLSACGGDTLFDHLQTVAAGWLRGPEVRELAAEVFSSYRRGDNKYDGQVRILWMIFGMELWYSAVVLG